jgi:hypothetical protein
VSAFGKGAINQRRVEVPRVHGDVAGMGVLDQHLDVVVIGFWLRERVVQHDVDVVTHGLVRVEFGDDDAVGVWIEEVGQADHDDVVVVDKGDADGWSSMGHGSTVFIRRGAHNRPERRLCRWCRIRSHQLAGGLVATLLWILAVILIIRRHRDSGARRPRDARLNSLPNDARNGNFHHDLAAPYRHERVRQVVSRCRARQPS